MATFSEAFDEGVQTAFCEALPSAISGGLLFTALTATTGAGAVGGIALSAGAAIAYATFCNRELPPEDFPEPAFSGGQCPGIVYRVNVSAGTRYLGGASGPPQDFGIATQEALVIAPIVSITGQSNNGSARVDVVGQTTVSILITGGITEPEQSKWQIYGVTINSVVREDGQPDTCGNPAPVIPPIPPGANTVNQPVTYNNYQGDTITNDYDFTFGYAQFNANGTVNVPVSVRVNANPRFDFTGNVNLNTGDFNVNLGDPSNPIGGGGDARDVVPPEDTPELPDDLPPSEPLPPGEPDKPEKRKILRGCIVTTTVVPSNQTEIFQSENPNIYVPDLGFVSFLVQVGNRTAWTQQIKVNNIRQIIECPWINGAIDVKGTPRPNCEFTITPLYTVQTFAAQYPPES